MSPPIMPMNLQMNVEEARGFKSGAQIARIVSEDWAKRNLYCPACANDELVQTRNNTKVFDFDCPACVARFQLKSSRRWDERRIPDAGYYAMMEAISKDSNPNLFVLHYDSNWDVRNLLLIPSFFLTSSAIEKRPPLAVTARRAGWVGCEHPAFQHTIDGKNPDRCGRNNCAAERGAKQIRESQSIFFVEHECERMDFGRVQNH